MLIYITRVDINHRQIDWKTVPVSLTLRFLNVHLQTEITKYCGVEQLVARWAHNPKVVSSSLTPATRENPEHKVFRVFYFQEASKACFCKRIGNKKQVERQRGLVFSGKATPKWHSLGRRPGNTTPPATQKNPHGCDSCFH